MSSKYLAVEGCQVTVKTPNQGTVNITGNPSIKVFQNIGVPPVVLEKAAYIGPVLPVSVSAAQNELATCLAASGAGVINASAQKTFHNELPVMREGDVGTILVNGQDPQGNACSFSVTVEITNAGQTKSEGE